MSMRTSEIAGTAMNVIGSATVASACKELSVIVARLSSGWKIAPEPVPEMCTQLRRTEPGRPVAMSPILSWFASTANRLIRFCWVAGGVPLVIVTCLALAAPLVTAYDPTQVQLRERKQIPSWAHPLGTDYEGRDILTRIIYGGRVSLAVAVLSVLLGTTVGAVWGVASAYIGGRFDLHSQRLLEVFMSFPPLVLAMVLVVG